MESQLSDPVRQCLARLHSLVELDLLLLMRELPDQEWSPTTLSRITQAELAQVRSALSHLSRGGLIDRLHGGEATTFRLNTASEAPQVLDEIAVLYVRCRAAVMRVIERRTR